MIVLNGVAQLLLPYSAIVSVYVREPTRSYAEFGQATYEILPDTHLTAGLPIHFTIVRVSTSISL